MRNVQVFWGDNDVNRNKTNLINLFRNDELNSIIGFFSCFYQKQNNWPWNSKLDYAKSLKLKSSYSKSIKVFYKLQFLQRNLSDQKVVVCFGTRKKNIKLQKTQGQLVANSDCRHFYFITFSKIQTSS